MKRNLSSGGKQKPGGRLYWRRVEGQQGWYAVYNKEVNADERIIRFWQEIFNADNGLEEVHEKYPVDKGHQKIKGL